MNSQRVFFWVLILNSGSNYEKHACSFVLMQRAFLLCSLQNCCKINEWLSIFVQMMGTFLVQPEKNNTFCYFFSHWTNELLRIDPGRVVYLRKVYLTRREIHNYSYAKTTWRRNTNSACQQTVHSNCNWTNNPKLNLQKDECIAKKSKNKNVNILAKILKKYRFLVLFGSS